MSYYSITEAEDALAALIARNKERLMGDLQLLLLQSLADDTLRNQCNANVVASFWLAGSFRRQSNPEPFVCVGAGSDFYVQFVEPECLAQNARLKARLCAFTGIDSLTCAREPHHLLVVKGEYFPFGGGIVRTFGRVEVIVSVSGFTPEQDHLIAERLWRSICKVLEREISSDLQFSRRAQKDPRRIKYPTGIVGRQVAHHVTAPEEPWVMPLLDPPSQRDLL